MPAWLPSGSVNQITRGEQHEDQRQRTHRRAPPTRRVGRSTTRRTDSHRGYDRTAYARLTMTPERSEEPAPTSETHTRVPPRIYAASLGDYGAGRLHGVWIDATGGYETVAAAIDQM